MQKLAIFMFILYKEPIKHVLFRKLFLLEKPQLFFPLAFGFSSGRIMNNEAWMMGGIFI